MNKINFSANVPTFIPESQAKTIALRNLFDSFSSEIEENKHYVISYKKQTFDTFYGETEYRYSLDVKNVETNIVTITDMNYIPSSEQERMIYFYNHFMEWLEL